MIDTMALGQPNIVAVYLLKGKKTALVDCGYASSSDTVLRGLTELGVSPSDVDYIIPTHVHLDHGGAAGHLLQKMTRAKVLAQDRGVPHLVDPTRLVDSATRLFGPETIEAYGLPIGVDSERIVGVSEEMHLDLGGISLTILHTPGHAPHQVSVLVEEERLILTADAVGILYPAVGTMIPTTPPPSFDPTLLGGTAERLGQTGPKKLLIPHYGIRVDPADVLETTRSKTKAWVEKVKTMKKEGLNEAETVDRLRNEVALEAGLRPPDLPAYASLSVLVSVKGILHYLEKNP